MRRSLSMVIAAVACTAALATALVATQSAPPPQKSFRLVGLSVYPAQNQSAQQQSLDEAACWDWAESQTGIHINVGGQVNTQGAAQAAGDQAAEATRGQGVQGAARGAAGGAAIGAIAGDTGKGAAIGAVAGGMAGRRGRRQEIQQAEQQGAQAAVNSNQQAVDQFKNAGAVCLQARGYTAG
jgi:hypothetical protein